MNGVLRLPKLASSQEVPHPREFQSQTPETMVQVLPVELRQKTQPQGQKEEEKKKKASLKRERIEKYGGKEE